MAPPYSEAAASFANFTGIRWTLPAMWLMYAYPPAATAPISTTNEAVDDESDTQAAPLTAGGRFLLQPCVRAGTYRNPLIRINPDGRVGHRYLSPFLDDHALWPFHERAWPLDAFRTGPPSRIGAAEPCYPTYLSRLRGVMYLTLWVAGQPE